METIELILSLFLMGFLGSIVISAIWAFIEEITSSFSFLGLWDIFLDVFNSSIKISIILIIIILIIGTVSHILNGKSIITNENIELNKQTISTCKSILTQCEQNEQVFAALKKVTEDNLTKYHDLNILPKKYQDIVPVSTIYEYFDIGICFKLQDKDGAYARYDTDLKLNKIIGNVEVLVTQLDKIQQQLNSIANNQRVLINGLNQSYKSINHISNQLCDINNSLTNIENSADITAYCSEVNKDNLFYLSILETFKTRS